MLFLDPVTVASCTQNFHNGPIPGDGSAYLLVACAHCRFDGNALNAHYGHHAQAPDPIVRQCGTDPHALITVSSDQRLFLARHITAKNNDGFCFRNQDNSGSTGAGVALSNAGLLHVVTVLKDMARDGHLAAPPSQPLTFDWDTWSLQDGPSMFDFNYNPAPPTLLCSLDEYSPLCGQWPDATAGPPAVRLLERDSWLSGAQTWEVSCAVECVLPLGRPRLSLSPTIAGQAVYIALQLRVAAANSHTYNGMAVPISLQIHDGLEWQSSSNQSYTTARGGSSAVSNGDWRVHSFMAMICWNGTHDEALFQLRMGGGQRINQTANATIQLAKIVVAPVGHHSL
eukprot:SAG22_NODE_210_length_15092_cov_81.740946_3_plen_341_part_00